MLRDVHHTKKSCCPQCQHVLNAVSSTDFKSLTEAPSSGDFIICMTCTAVLRFDAEVMPQMLTPEDHAEIDSISGYRKYLSEQVSQLRVRRAGQGLQTPARSGDFLATGGGCYICGDRSPGHLRPYGKGGKPICFECMQADPERKAEAKRQVEKLLDAAGPVPVYDPDKGFSPMDPNDDRPIVLLNLATGKVVKPEEA